MKTLIIISVIVAVLFLMVVQPGPSGVAASLRLPDGSEYMVTQRCNWSVEPYTISFYMRSSGKPWGWCYIDHEASRWWDVAMTYDAAADVITITERGTWKAALDRKRSTFAIGDAQPGRGAAAPQHYYDPEFPFP